MMSVTAKYNCSHATAKISRLTLSRIGKGVIYCHLRFTEQHKLPRRVGAVAQSAGLWPCTVAIFEFIGAAYSHESA